MRVEVGGDGSRAVPEPFTHDLDRDTRRQGEAGTGVAEVVEADTREASEAHESFEEVGEVFRAERGAVLAREDQAGLNPRGAPPLAFAILLTAVRLQDLDRKGVKGYSSYAAAGLRRAEICAATSVYELL